MSRYEATLAAKVPKVGKLVGRGVEAGRHREERAGEDSRLLRPDRRRDGREARRVRRAHDLPVVDPRAHQLRLALEQRVLRHVRRDHEARREDRGLPDAAGLPHPVRRREPCDVEAQPRRSRQPRHCRSCSPTRRRTRSSPSSTRPRRAGRSAPSFASSSRSSAGAATRSTTSRTSPGGRTSRSRCRASRASSVSTTARIPRSTTSARSSSASSCSPRLGPKLAERPGESRRSLTSCTKPLVSASRSLRTTRSTSTSSASASSAGSCSPSATVSCRRASSTKPTTCSSSVEREVPDALLNGGDHRARRRGRASHVRGRGQGRRPRCRGHAARDPRRRAARPVHGRAGLPPPRHGPARRQPRPEHHQGGRRVARVC